VPEPVAAQLAAALAEPKEGLRKAALAAAGSVLRAAPGLAGQLGALAAPLAKIVAEGMAKAVARGNGIVALQLAAQIAAADAAAGGVWTGRLRRYIAQLGAALQDSQANHLYGATFVSNLSGALMHSGVLGVPVSRSGRQVYVCSAAHHPAWQPACRVSLLPTLYNHSPTSTRRCCA
jgi:hypothetical protein